MRSTAPRRRSTGAKQKTNTKKRRRTLDLILRILDEDPKKLYSTEALLVALHDQYHHYVSRTEFGGVLTRAYRDGLLLNAHITSRNGDAKQRWKRWYERPDYEAVREAVWRYFLRSGSPSYPVSGSSLNWFLELDCGFIADRRFHASFAWALERMTHERALEWTSEHGSGLRIPMMRWLELSTRDGV